MGRRRCCCGCEIGSDNFNRDDSLTLGPRWPDVIEGNTAQTGDWDIKDNTATENYGAGRAIFHKKHPTPDESMVAQVSLPDMQVGDKYEIIVNWLDFQNFHYAQAEVESEGPGGVLFTVLRLYSVGSGVESLLAEVQVGRVWPNPITGLCEATLHAKIGREGFCASLYFTEVPIVWAITSVVPHGYWAGMGASGRPGMAVDDFVFLEHLETDPKCPYCVCKCDNKPIPKKLTATIVDCTGRMTCVDGCEIELEWQQHELGYTPAFNGWYGINLCCSPACYMDVNFICGLDQTVESMQCTVPATCNTGAINRFAGPGSTCNPIFFRFGPFSVGSTDYVCGCGEMDEWGQYGDGEFYIEITE